MVQHAVIRTGQLERGWVLAPERYDPRRRSAGTTGALVRDIATVTSTTVQPGPDDGRRFLVLDTSDASEGFIRLQRGPQRRGGLGSAKKTAMAGDVIISRLRPYLRQVGLVDDALLALDGRPHVLALSTEFIVLRPIGAESIAFLVPFLLGAEIQAILAVSQEGGHHPRIAAAVIEELVVPEAVMAERARISSAVEEAVALARRSERQMRQLSGRILAAAETDPAPESATTGQQTWLRDGPGD